MKVSVLMPVYQVRETLPAALNSILAQTLGDFEVIAVDDCSTDGSRQILENYAKKDQRIRILVNEVNLGVVGSLNAAAGIAGGEYLARMDGDDESLPHRFEVQARYLQDHPEVGMVGGQVYLMGAAAEDDFPNVFPTGPAEMRDRMMSDNCLCHPAVMLRTEVFRKLGGYRPEFRNSEDYDLWLRALNAGYEVANVSEYVLRYRLSLGGATIGKRWEQYLYYRLAQACFADRYRTPALDLWPSVQERYGSVESEFLAESLFSTGEQLLKLRRFRDAGKVLSRIPFSPRISWARSAAQTVLGGLLRIPTTRQIEKFYRPYS